MSDTGEYSAKAYVYLEVASKIAMVFLLPLMVWVLVTVQRHDVQIAEIRANRFTAVDGLNLQTQITELALTTQAAVEQLRRLASEAERTANDNRSRIRKLEGGG